MAVPGLVGILEAAKGLGFLGPGPVERHIDHARAFAQALPGQPPGCVVDLGSGGGVPGLVLAHVWHQAQVILVESSERRSRFLDDAVEALAFPGRVQVVCRRAEEVGRDPEWRSGADVVTARSFASPAVTAECAAPLLRVGGYLVVSEPPANTEERWPAAGIVPLGLGKAGRFTGNHATMQVLRQETLCPRQFPRRVGVPAKRPLF